MLLASKIFSSRILEEYQDRYSSLSSLIGENIRETEESAERTMLNSALLVRSLDEHGILSTAELKALAQKTSVTHIFIIDQEGQFIRSTNEDPGLIPNLFSFCPDYKNRLNSHGAIIDATPIIQPHPEPNPFKFLIIPNSAGDRLISVGLRVDFLSSSLKRFQQQDPNIQAIEIYSPRGGLLGRFGPKEVELLGDRLEEIPQMDFDLLETDDALLYSQWTASNHRDCCQCKTSGDVRNGHYDYLIRTQVSKAALIEAQNSLFVVLCILGLFSVLISLVLARLISTRLVTRLKMLHRQVGANLNNNSGLEPLDESGSDELSDLSRSFNELLRQREKHQKDQVELERLKKEEELSSLAAQVSHDVQSPVSTLRMLGKEIQPRLKDEHREILEAVTNKLQEMTSALLRRYRGEREHEIRPIEDLASSIHRIVDEKRLEFAPRVNVLISVELDPELGGLAIPLSETELARVLSNLINNAVESCDDLPSAEVQVIGKLSTRTESVRIEVIDNGRGIPSELVPKLLSSGGTYKKAGHGFGLKHARSSLESIGGRLSLASAFPTGTKVSLRIPIRLRRELPEGFRQMVLIEDDKSVQKAWALQAAEMGIEFYSAESETEIPFNRISKDAEIYVDGHLAEGRSGVDVCKKLYKLGYQKLYLASSDYRIKCPDYVVRVGKDFPFSRSA